MSSRSDEFLLKEYDSAVRLTYHVDELRAKLTGFYVTFSGIAGAGLFVLLKGEASSYTGFVAETVVAVLMGLVGFVGVLVVAIVARLRRIQLEHFRIVNKIRRHFLGTDEELRDVAELSSRTLPVPNRRSGSYCWLLLIVLVSAFFLSFAVWLYTHLVVGITSNLLAGSMAFVLFLVFSVSLEGAYFALAKPLPAMPYRQTASCAVSDARTE